MSQLTIRPLGAPGIVRDGASVAVDTRKATPLLAYLAVTGRNHARESLAALLWPEYDDEHARAALRRTLSTLRAALGEPYMAIDRETVGLIPDAGLWVDVTEFRARLAACRTHGHPPADVCPACLPSLAEAAAFYRDDFLAGFNLPRQRRVRRLAVRPGRKPAAGTGRGAGETDARPACPWGLRWCAGVGSTMVGVGSLREEAHRQVMRLYAWIGQRNTALHQYRECVRIMEQELGVAPLAETTELYEAIKGDRLLRAADLSSFQKPEKAQPAPGEDPIDFQRHAWSLPLVGRVAELTTLVRAYERHATGGYFVVVEGEAGMGKTRLAEEFLRGPAHRPR